MDTHNDLPPTTEHRLGLVDYFLAILDHIWLLLLVPLLLAGAAYGVAKLVPKQYTSVAWVFISPNDQRDSAITPAQAAAMMKSREVLDAVVASKVIEGDADQAADHITAAVSKENMVRLEAEAGSPEQARKLADVVLQAWLKTTLPGERERAELKARAERTQANLANVQAAVEALARSLGAGERSQADTKVRLADLSETGDKLFVTLQQVQRRLEGLPQEVVRQAPTLAERPSFPRPLPTAAKTWLVTLALLLLAIVLLRRVDAARSDPAVDAKLSRILPRRREGRA